VAAIAATMMMAANGYVNCGWCCFRLDLLAAEGDAVGAAVVGAGVLGVAVGVAVADGAVAAGSTPMAVVSLDGQKESEPWKTALIT